ncbi:MAG TPA: hypothetical protein VLB44_05635, partial [Kofleriaceae bacterium]|nr:hypothetical protein [Kofleriaceae bacterium]
MPRALLLLALASCHSVDAAPGAATTPTPAPAQAPAVTQAPTCTCPEPGSDDQAAVPPPTHDQLKLTKVKFTDLPGWTDDKQSEAIPSFLASCAQLATRTDDAPVGADGHGGNAKQWRHACEVAAKLKAGDDKA